jgi:hypothetical protein
MNTPLLITACILAYVNCLHFIMHPVVSHDYAIVVMSFLFSAILSAAIESSFLKWLHRTAFACCIGVDLLILYYTRAHHTNMLVCIIAILLLHGISYYWKRHSLSENLIPILHFEITLLDTFALTLMVAVQIDIVNALSKSA